MSKLEAKSNATTEAQLRQVLFNLKMEVVNIHQGDELKYVRMTVARDACFTSHNAMNWKSNQMGDLQTEIAGLIPEEGSEVVNVNLERKVELYGKMENELGDLVLRHEADLAVYEEITGEKWRPTSSGTVKKKKAKSGLRAKALEIAAK